MERNMHEASGKPTKTNPEALHTPGAVTPTWGKPDDAKRSLSPAPPPVWTRYIDSRLKQFCSR